MEDWTEFVAARTSGDGFMKVGKWSLQLAAPLL